MHSLKNQILILLLGSLVILAASFLLVLGWYTRNQSVSAAIVKAQSDLAACSEIINLKYPGTWEVQDGELYKGNIKVSLNNSIVDELSKLTGDNVTFFLGSTRVATTVRGSNGERAIGTKVSANVAQTVLQNGQTYLGEAEVVGQLSETGYLPIRAANGDIIGMFYVGISHDYDRNFIAKSLTTMAELGLALTLVVAFLTWWLIKKVIIRTLRNITSGTQDVAAGQQSQQVNVSDSEEIKELAESFSHMAEQIQTLTGEINQIKQSKAESITPNAELQNAGGEPLPKGDQSIELPAELHANPQIGQESPWRYGGECLPKGLNKATLNLIVQFLKTTHRPLSADEVAEGVKLTRVTVRRYLEFLEQQGILRSDQKFGTVGRPVKIFILL